MASQAEVRAVDNAIEAAEQSGWLSAWERLKAVALDLDNAAFALEEQRDYALARPDLAREFSVRAGALEAAKSKLTWARDAIRSVLGYFGVQLEGLGFIPLIPLALVLAAIAYLAKLAADTWAFATRLKEQRRLEEQGIAPAEAARIAAQLAAGSSGGSSFGGLTGVALITGAVIVGLMWWRNRK